MDKVKSYWEILNAISAVKELRKGYLTNLYAEVDKIKTWINKGKLYKTIITNTAFFVNENNESSQLFYCSPSINDLNDSLSRLRTQADTNVIVLDIIGKKPEIAEVVEVFKNNEFFIYTILNRMSRITPKDNLYDNPTELIKKRVKHSETILHLLNKHFDPIAEQLPTYEEIENWQSLNQIITIEDNKEILGFVIYDLIGYTSYLRYWFVHPKYRNRKIGSLLLREFFRRTSESKRQLFWVIQTNHNAISRYLHYGFLPENLFDFVMTNKKIQYETENN